MSKRSRSGLTPLEEFYVWASLRLNLDSVEVDNILAQRGLKATNQNIQQCRRALRQMGHYPQGR